MNSSSNRVDLIAITTLADWLQASTEVLTQSDIVYGHGTDNPWDEVVAIARYVLQLPVDADEATAKMRLTDLQKQQLTVLLTARLEQRVPVAYLTHQAWFAGYCFFVDERVLIPRSPIAELIEQQFMPWIVEQKVQKIVDIGTGSGCIAIACAKAFAKAQVDAVDIDESALQVATINCREHGVTGQVHLHQGDLFSPLVAQRYDVIISNPPYVDKHDMASLPMEYTHEPELALTAGDDGLDIVIRLLATAIDHITEHGILIVEVGNSAEALQRAFPEVDFMWLEFARGGEGIFLLTAAQLKQFDHAFQQAFNARCA